MKHSQSASASAFRNLYRMYIIRLRVVPAKWIQTMHLEWRHIVRLIDCVSQIVSVNSVFNRTKVREWYLIIFVFLQYNVFVFDWYAVLF